MILMNNVIFSCQKYIERFHNGRLIFNVFIFFGKHISAIRCASMIAFSGVFILAIITFLTKNVILLLVSISLFIFSLGLLHTVSRVEWFTLIYYREFFKGSVWHTFNLKKELYKKEYDVTGFPVRYHSVFLDYLEPQILRYCFPESFPPASPFTNS